MPEAAASKRLYAFSKHGADAYTTIMLTLADGVCDAAAAAAITVRLHGDEAGHTGSASHPQLRRLPIATTGAWQRP